MAFTYYTEPTTGTEIATDNIGLVRYQIMKMDIGALGSNIPLTGSVLDDSQQGAGMQSIRVGGMMHVYNAASDLWTRVRSANNLTDNFGGGTALGVVIGGKNAAGNFDLLREIDAASGSTGRGILAFAPVGFTGGVFQAFQLDSNNLLKIISTQLTSPWIVSGGISLGSPIPPGGNNIGIVSVVGPLSVTVSGTPTVNQGTTPWITSGGVSIGSPLPPGTSTIGVVNQGTNNTAANAWPIHQSDNFVTSTFTATGQTLVVSTSGASTVFVTVSGSTSTIVVEGSGDGVSWTGLQAFSVSGTTFGPGANLSYPLVTNWIFILCGSLSLVRLRCSTFGNNCLVSLNAGAGSYDRPVTTLIQGAGNSGSSPWAVSGTITSNISSNAVSHGSNPTSGAVGASLAQIANQYGIPFSIGGHPNTQTLRASYTTAQTGTIIVSGNAQSKIVVTHILVTVDKAVSVNTSMRIGFGTSSTPTTSQVLTSHPGIDAGSGVNVGDGAGILGIGLVSDNVLVDCSVPTGGSIEIIITYYTVPS